MHLLKAAAWLAMMVASLRDFPHFLMISCKSGFEQEEIPLSVFEILLKELLSGDTSPDHLLTDFPGHETAGSEDECIAYHLI